MLVVMLIGIVSDAFVQVVIFQLFACQALDGLPDSIEGLDLLRDQFRVGNRFVFVHDPIICDFLLQEGGFEIGVTEILPENIKFVLGLAGQEVYAARGFGQAVGDVLFLGNDMCKDVSHSPGAGHTADPHARGSDIIDQQFPFFAFVLQTG